MMSKYTHETDAHLSVYARVDIIAMCSANHSAIKQQYSKNQQKDQNLIQTLMGNDVASRKDFIVDNAINVINLDI